MKKKKSFISEKWGGEYPFYRPRRLRRSEVLRRLMRETRFSLDQLIMPYFVCEGTSVKEPIAAMPGQYRFSIDQLLIELEALVQLGVHAILLFGIPSQKDLQATDAWSKDGIIQSAIPEIKRRFKDLLVITDVCLCAYMSHGHCGIINARGEVDNDGSLKLLSHVALSLAEAGSDMVAPSDMMDGRVRAIRETLDEKGFQDIPVMSYAAKYASAFYGPFREAAKSAPQTDFLLDQAPRIPKDRKSYQIDPPNRDEALREIAMDIKEGADMVMVKPALAYLDIIREASKTFCFPLAAYAVSGEYAMVKAAAERGMIDEKSAVIEMMTAMARAGATALITYHAKQIAVWEREFTSLGSVKKVM